MNPAGLIRALAGRWTLAVLAELRFAPLVRALDAVALLVGAIGVANIMIIAVLGRRSEIGLRRALGATNGHIRLQFLSEAILLSAGPGTGRLRG